MKTRLVSFLLLSAACGGGGDMPTDEEHVTFASLPQADKDQFAAWKARPIKDCAWEQAFPALAEEFPSPSGEPYVAEARVDLPALLAANGGSPILAGAEGQLALLGEPGVELGFAHDERKVRRTVNGKARVFEISANRENDVCVVTLDGEELYRAELPAAVPVIAWTDPEARAAAGTDLAPLVEVQPPAGEAMAALDSGPLLRHTLAALAPQPRAHTYLAGRFATPVATIRTLFPLEAARPPDVIRVVSTPGITPFAPLARAYGTRAALDLVHDGATVEVELLYRGLHPQLLSLRAQLALDAGGKNVRATAITVGTPVAPSDQATAECFTARRAAALFEVAQARSPSFAEQFSGCEKLSADGFAALAASAPLRQQIATTAMGPGVSPTRTYRGWDVALVGLAQRLDEQGVSLAELDPANSLPALATVLERRATLRAAITTPETAKALDRSLIALSFGWFFDGLTPSAPVLADLEGALGSAAVAFPESVARMLIALADDVAPASDGALAAHCGAALVGERRAQIDRVLAALAEVPFAADFTAARRDELLQECLAGEALGRLEASVPAVRSFITEDQTRAAGSSLFPLTAKPLVTRALEERWTAATFTALVDVLGFALITDYTFCAGKPSRAEQADCVDGSVERLSTDEDGLLARPRQAVLARELASRWPGLADNRFFDARYDIARAFFAGLWRACGDDGFDRAKARLFALIEALKAATTFDQRFDLEEEIRDLVGAETCPL